MALDQIPRKLALLISAAMLLGGLLMGGWAITQLAGRPAYTTNPNSDQTDDNVAAANAFLAHVSTTTAQDRANLTDAEAIATMSALAASITTPAPTTTRITTTVDAPSDTALEPTSSQIVGAALDPQVDVKFEIIPAGVRFSSSVPARLRRAVEESVLVGAGAIFTTTEPSSAALTIDLNAQSSARRGRVVYAQMFAAASYFDTVDPNITWDELVTVWQGASEPYAAVVVLTDTLPALQQILSTPGPTVRGVATIDQVTTAARTEPTTLALVPFDELIPRLTVLAIDGQNPVENENRFTPSRYPLVARFYAHNGEMKPEQRPLVHNLLLQLPPSNRDADRLTVVAMTGVTAMVRQTAAAMDANGYAWPAEVIGPELAAADITHISNEVPFVPGCPTDTRAGNLTFCSKPEYMATLDAVGADIVGMTGNHQNDFGVEDALGSFKILADANLPVYGGGVNKEEAFKPLYLMHNGNRLAFLGANSFGPEFAWATDQRPGSAPFDLNIMSALIRNIKAQGKADVVLTEIQFEESYQPYPLPAQRETFNAVLRAGADIVTGVQSHVPQSMEFTEGRLILYGLGNIFFDQMWSQETRDGFFVKHTIYEGRHISTQLFTTIIYEYGQPRWTTLTERERILSRLFAVSYWE